MREDVFPLPLSTAGDLLYRSAFGNTRLAAGLDGTVLSYDTGTSAPVWDWEPSVKVRAFTQAGIEAAIVRAQERNISWVDLPPGSYPNINNLSVPVHIKLRGQGRRGASTTQQAFLIGASGASVMINVTGNFVELHNLGISDNGATVGIQLTTVHNTVINGCALAGFDSSGQAAIKGGGCIGTQIVHNVFNNNATSILMLNMYASNPAATYYGIDNIGVIGWNSFAGAGEAIRVDGSPMIISNDIEGNSNTSGMKGKIVLGDSTSAQVSHIRVWSNYFELVSGTESIVAISIQYDGDYDIQANLIYGYQKTSNGSVGVHVDTACSALRIEGNWFKRWDYGIKIDALYQRNHPVSMLQNDFSADSFGCNTNIDAGNYGAHYQAAAYALNPSGSYHKAGEGERWFGKGWIPSMVRLTGTGAAVNYTADLNRGNAFSLETASAADVIVSNDTNNQGEPVWINTRNKGLTLSAAEFGLAADFTPEADSILAFMVDDAGQVRPIEAMRVRVEKVAALPTATSALRGRIYRVEGGAGVADTVSVCIKNAGDTYEWASLI